MYNQKKFPDSKINSIEKKSLNIIKGNPNPNLKKSDSKTKILNIKNIKEHIKELKQYYKSIKLNNNKIIHKKIKKF